MEQTFNEEQRVKVIGADIHDEHEMELVGQAGIVRSFDAQTGLYMVYFDNGRIRPFYGQELEAAHDRSQ